jgi:hypothetical protein
MEKTRGGTPPAARDREGRTGGAEIVEVGVCTYAGIQSFDCGGHGGWVEWRAFWKRKLGEAWRL